MEQTHTPPEHLIAISRGDRWSAYCRLQELEIPCTCPEDGTLRAVIDTPTAAIQLRSVVQQLVAPRQHLLDWLERCWQSPAGAQG